jgi:acyl-CoA ligase (AMP-forming) (exosortase A-associated)
MNVPPEFTLNHLLLNSAERSPGAVAVVDGTAELSFEGLVLASRRMAGLLGTHGVRRGDRVGIYLEKSLEAVIAMLGTSLAGAVFVNLNPLLKADQVRHIMADCGVSTLIADPDRLPADGLPPVGTLLLTAPALATHGWARSQLSLAAELPTAAPTAGHCNATSSDLATIIYTSGSTGRPKGIMFTHGNVVAGAQIVTSYLQNTPEDRVLCVLPFSFDYGLNQLISMLRVGGTAVLQRSLLPGDILRALRSARITGLAGVPPLWAVLMGLRRSLLREPLRELRYITNSGGMIPGAHLAALREMLPHTRIFLMYGLTEAFRSTYVPPEEIGRGPACIGKAIPDTDVWVVDANGRETAPGEVGELIHRGPTVALGYWGDPEKTNSVYRPNPFSPPGTLGRDTVVYSGDLVFRDEDGFLYYVGRRDEQIKTEGYRVSPQEVEDLLCSAPGVHQAAVFGKKDEVLGHRVVAVLSLLPGAETSEEAIRQHCAARAPHYLVPREIHILPELPRTSSGKLDRSALKREYATTDSS